MEDDHRHRPDGGRAENRDRGREGGPEDSTFLDLEISKVLAAEADALSRDAAREILRDAIKARLVERIGPRLTRLGRLAADELADDIEANLEIEARIAARRDARKNRDQRVEAALSGRSVPADGAGPRAAKRRR